MQTIQIKTPLDILPLLGIRKYGLLPAIVFPLLLTTSLFLGPLVMQYYDTNSLIPTIPYNPLVGVRNLLVAPFTEELFFRSGLISYLLASGISPSTSLWVSPFLFGFAHLHHMYDLVVHQGWSWKHAVLRCAFQFGYTLVFGWFASFILLRTGHFVSLFLVHSFCNLMGFPRFTHISRHSKSKVITLAFVGGILSFLCMLHPLTRPSMYFSVDTSSLYHYYEFTSLFRHT